MNPEPAADRPGGVMIGLRAFAALLVLARILPAAAADVGSAVSPKAAGTETRDWVTGPDNRPLPRPSLEITELSAQRVKMRDGVELTVRTWLPADASADGRRFPCVLAIDGYGPPIDPQIIPPLPEIAKYGYAVAFARLRGTPPSGASGFLEKYGRDGYDLVEWMAAQTWCNGRVGMVGPSMLGMSQWLVAKEAPPHLVSIAPDVGGSGDAYWDAWWEGGMRPGPSRMARRNIPGVENEFELAINHPDFDSFWRERTATESDLAAVAKRGTAVLVAGSWDDYLNGAKAYRALQRAGAGQRAKLIMGPWPHIGFLWWGPSPRDRAPQRQILPVMGFDYLMLWLDRWVKGNANGVDAEPAALIYVQGPNQWRFEKGFPLPDEDRVKLYLGAAKSGTSDSRNDGSLLTAPMGGASVSYEYSPRGPYNAAAITDAGRVRFDKRPWERHGLAWTAPALDRPTEVSGFPTFEFWALSSAADTDFVVELTDVAPDGTSLQVTRGYLNGPHALSRSSPQPLRRDMPQRFAIELVPTSYVFAAGHRIRVTLQGAAMDPTTGIAWQGPALNPHAATVTVLQDLQHPSYIELPFIGATPSR